MSIRTRVKAALRSNDVQMKAVGFMTILNLVAFPMDVWQSSTPLANTIRFAVSILVWPLLAFIANLISPIPEYHE